VLSFAGQPLSGLIQAKDGSLYGASAGYNYYGNPNDAGFLFRVSIPAAAAPKLRAPSKSENAVLLSWSAISGRTYQVQSTTDPGGNDWTDVGGPTTASNAVAGNSDSSATNDRFYRVVMLP
jgi:hypothetical protein